ncbi:hypothetical protein [Streptomyces sp. NPDC059893]
MTHRLTAGRLTGNRSQRDNRLTIRGRRMDHQPADDQLASRLTTNW